MSNLNDLVPPLNLCKLIPQGEFEDSCFVRMGKKPYTIIERRLIRKDVGKQDGVYTAPTLQEILAVLPPYSKNEQILACCVPDWADFSARVFGESWRVGYTGNCSINDKNPATAALKLWLKLKGIEVKKS